MTLSDHDVFFFVFVWFKAISIAFSFRIIMATSYPSQIAFHNQYLHCPVTSNISTWNGDRSRY